MLHSSHQDDLTAVFKAAQDRDYMFLDTPARKLRAPRSFQFFKLSHEAGSTCLEVKYA